MRELAKKEHWFFRIPLEVGGIITVVIGIGHIFMPQFGYDSTVPESMKPAIQAHFYYLGTYAICCFLLAFGFLSIFLSRFKASVLTVVFTNIMAMVWIIRAALEFRFPVELKIFMLKAPHSTLSIVLIVLAMLYSVSSIYGWKVREKWESVDHKI